MADYAGAVAAMRARFEAGFTAAPIMFQNETPPREPWPPVDSNGQPTSWVYFEVIQANSDIRGAGTLGNNVWLTSGHIFIHVFTPKDYALPESLRLSDLAGEVFRAQTFYNDGAGAKVVCMAPMTDGGASDADNGNWFRLTVSVPFEFFFLK